MLKKKTQLSILLQEIQKMSVIELVHPISIINMILLRKRTNMTFYKNKLFSLSENWHNTAFYYRKKRDIWDNSLYVMLNLKGYSSDPIVTLPLPTIGDHNIHYEVC